MNFTPDGSRLVTAGRDLSIRIWDAQTLKRIGILVGCRHPAASMSVSPDGKTLATQEPSNRTLRLWSLVTFQELVQTYPLRGEQLPVGLSFATDGKSLLVAEAVESGGSSGRLQTSRIDDASLGQRTLSHPDVLGRVHQRSGQPSSACRSCAAAGLRGSALCPRSSRL